MAKRRGQPRGDRKERRAARGSARESSLAPTHSPGVRLISYEIHPDYGQKWNHDLSDEQVAEINAFTDRFIVSEEREALVEEAEEMVRRYPQVAQMKSHLFTAYACAGRKEDSERVRREMLELHPDYLFAKLNEFHRLMDEGRHDKVLDRFGAFALDDLLGGRTQVHPDEMLAYCLMSGRFALETNRMDSANASLKMMESIAPDSEMTEALRMRIKREQMSEILGALQRLVDFSKGRRNTGRRAKPDRLS